jgi:class 3 adenylate cyclase
VGPSAHVNIVAIGVDLRGSTQWANLVAEKDFRYVKTFMDDFVQWVLSNAKTSSLGRPSYAKFLGDGVLIVWEVPEEAMAASVNAGVKLACCLHKNYSPWVRRNARKYTWGVPSGIGIGVDVGTAVRLTFENGPNDYIGAPVSYASKLQNYARPNGGVAVQEKVYNLLNGYRNRFTRREILKIGASGIGVRITK